MSNVAVMMDAGTAVETVADKILASMGFVFVSPNAVICNAVVTMDAGTAVGNAQGKMPASMADVYVNPNAVTYNVVETMDVGTAVALVANCKHASMGNVYPSLNRQMAMMLDHQITETPDRPTSHARKMTTLIAAKVPNTHQILVPVVSKDIVPAAPPFALVAMTAVPLLAALVRNHAVKMACVTVVITVVEI